MTGSGGSSIPAHPPKARLKIIDDWVSAKADYMDQLDQAARHAMDGYTRSFPDMR